MVKSGTWIRKKTKKSSSQRNANLRTPPDATVDNLIGPLDETEVNLLSDEEYRQVDAWARQSPSTPEFCRSDFNGTGRLGQFPGSLGRGMEQSCSIDLLDLSSSDSESSQQKPVTNILTCPALFCLLLAICNDCWDRCFKDTLNPFFCCFVCRIGQIL